MGLIAPVRILFADVVDLLALGGFRKLGQIAPEAVWCFIPHALAERRHLGLAGDGAGFVSALVILGGVGKALFVLRIAAGNVVVIACCNGGLCQAKKNSRSNS